MRPNADRRGTTNQCRNDKKTRKHMKKMPHQQQQTPNERPCMKGSSNATTAKSPLTEDHSDTPNEVNTRTVTTTSDPPITATERIEAWLNDPEEHATREPLD